MLWRNNYEHGFDTFQRCGRRFGDTTPKQYNLLLGKEVISYVIEVAMFAKNVDKIVCVASGE